MNSEPTSRAYSMAELTELLGRCFPPDQAVASIQSYRPQPTDIIISPFGKCGTTRLQQTFHCLRTRGDMAFDDISRVVPWIETAKACGIDLQAPQRGEPRGFKSHLSYDRVPKGVRYVVSLRDPKDAMVSMFRFMEGWFIEPGSITISEFAQSRLAVRDRGTDYWHHLISWWEQRENPDVLLLSYEHMSADPLASIRKLANFCDLKLDDDLLAVTREHSSLAFMLAHKDQFDDLLMRQVSERRGNLPPGSDSAKVRQGQVGGHHAELPPDVAAALDAVWAEAITPKLGFSDYAELQAALRA